MMSDYSIEMSIPADNDGYVTFQCPFCNEKFKLSASEVQEDDVINLFCPYCGLQDEPSHFLSDEVLEQAQIIASNFAKSLLNDFMKGLEKSFKRNKVVSIKPGKKFELEEDKVLIELDDLEIVKLLCCKRSLKARILDKEIGVYCPYCGVK